MNLYLGVAKAWLLFVNRWNDK